MKEWTKNETGNRPNDLPLEGEVKFRDGTIIFMELSPLDWRLIGGNRDVMAWRT